jgi:aspartate ammonia-lyase
VNFGQSTNDVYPTAFHLGLLLRLESYMEALRQLQEAFFAKAREFDRVLKMGRTHLQDAVPMSLGAEFRGWGTTIGEEVNHLAEVGHILHGINLGATAIGTTVTAAPGYPALATKHLADITGIKFTLAADLIEATSTGDYVCCPVSSSTPRSTHQICNDPACWPPGRAAVRPDQPAPDAAGSSIMPGKVNP